MEQQILINTNITSRSTVLFMGFDCSSKAIHSVWVDQNERLITQCKWGSKKKNFEERFLEFGVDFWDSLSKIKVINNVIMNNKINLNKMINMKFKN